MQVFYISCSLHVLFCTCRMILTEHALRALCNWLLQAVINILEGYIKFKRINQCCPHSKISQSISIQLISTFMKVRKLWSCGEAKNCFNWKNRHNKGERYVDIKAPNHWKSKEIGLVREQQSCLWLSAEWTSYEDIMWCY